MGEIHLISSTSAHCNSRRQQLQELLLSDDVPQRVVAQVLKTEEYQHHLVEETLRGRRQGYSKVPKLPSSRCVVGR